MDRQFCIVYKSEELVGFGKMSVTLLDLHEQVDYLHILSNNNHFDSNNSVFGDKTQELVRNCLSVVRGHGGQEGSILGYLYTKLICYYDLSCLLSSLIRQLLNIVLL